MILYFALIESNLEFAALVWNPHTINNVEAIEQIQKRLLKYLILQNIRLYRMKSYCEVLKWNSGKQAHGSLPIVPVQYAKR